MKRKLAFALCTALALHLGTGAAPVSALAQEKADLVTNAKAGQEQTLADKRPVIHPGGPRFGAYDPHGDFGDQTDVATEHLFLPWEDVDLESLRMADAYALQRKRKLLVTIEPWSWSLDWKLSPTQLRDRMLRGEYDANMEAIADMLAEMKSPVIVRWGQEMEDTSGRFSWAGWAPKDYVQAYKHAMDIVRKRVPNVQLMWSPKGLPNLGEYYPGDDYVDLVGLSVFGLEPYDAIEYGGPHTFKQALKPGYDLVAKYHKPIWVAEMGWQGSTTYMQPWIDAATQPDPDFPNLAEVVYFNDRDVHDWPHDLGRPNWRVVTDATN
ncbi:glycosyl hydrolase [Ensifer sp.]|uniref:glycoside hydrolase family 26 protein n=1 Tax=Ensifer sp. TaxID=1872086 RepID=UPI00289AF18E|nr:glycosyl hydrolase [Ensifer sp.]